MKNNVEEYKKKARIILVDDSPTDAKLVEFALRKTRWVEELKIFQDGPTAFEFLQEGEWVPHLILLDINMPGMNGLELLEKIKTDEKMREIPVIMLTTSSAPSDIRAAYRGYANCYITKPPDFSAFAETWDTLEKFWSQTVKIPADL